MSGAVFCLPVYNAMLLGMKRYYADMISMPIEKWLMLYDCDVSLLQFDVYLGGVGSMIYDSVTYFWNSFDMLQNKTRLVSFAIRFSLLCYSILYYTITTYAFFIMPIIM